MGVATSTRIDVNRLLHPSPLDRGLQYVGSSPTGRLIEHSEARRMSNR